MSTLKPILAVLAIALILTFIFQIDIVASKPLLLIFGGIIVILLAISFFEILGELIGIFISLIAFLFLVYLFLLILKFLT
ncbi:hypothetical protein HY988_00010 [Candidatus Micrarchaeota archaeon]|nr:hypothetical protein [Candidatus Micrarchaeota archaeon]